MHPFSPTVTDFFLFLSTLSAEQERRFPARKCCMHFHSAHVIPTAKSSINAPKVRLLSAKTPAPLARAANYFSAKMPRRAKP